MGFLNRNDAKLFRGYFDEMCKLLGISVGYSYIVKKEMTIHGEDKSTYSALQRINILFDENPKVDTLNRLGWMSELNDQKPIVANLPYNTPNLTVGAKLFVESVSGIGRPRVFKITHIATDLEYPDAYTCIIVPVFDQYIQKNQYTLVNNEKINVDVSERTSKDQPYIYLTGKEDIDSTPDKNKEWADKYSFINNKKSPYSG